MGNGNYAVSVKAVHEYAALVACRNKAGMPISTEDAQIAAIALQNDLVLATRNSKNFRNISGLVLLDPWQGKNS